MQKQSQRQGGPDEWPFPVPTPDHATPDHATPDHATPDHATPGQQAPEGATPGPGASSAPQEARQRVQEEAYRIAQERGFPDNAALEHWLEAERRLNSGSASEQH